MGRRHTSDPALLWLWCRPAAAAPTGPLAWEAPKASPPKKGRKEQYHRSSPTGVRVQNFTSGSPAWRSGILGRSPPGAFGVESQQGFYSGAQEDWGKQTLLLENTHRISCAPGPRAKQGLHKNLGQTNLQVLECLLGKQEAAVAHCGGRMLEAEIPGNNHWHELHGGRHF